MLIAIAAQFSLELRHFNVANASVHAPIHRLVYMRMPRGYVRQGTILQLQKALYSLWISPLLWQKDVIKYLTSIGFLLVPHRLCCVMCNRAFIFFYINNIIILCNHLDERDAAEKAVKEPQKKYNLTRVEPLK